MFRQIETASHMKLHQITKTDGKIKINMFTKYISDGFCVALRKRQF